VRGDLFAGAASPTGLIARALTLLRCPLLSAVWCDVGGGVEVRDTLATYFKTHNLEAAAATAADADTAQAAGAAAAGAAEGGRVDRSCVVVPPTDGLYALATSAAAAASAAAAVKPAPPVAASAVPPSLPPARSDDYEDFDDMDVEGEGPIGGPGTVGGVWMPPVGGGGPWGTSSSVGANLLGKPVAVGFAAPAGGGPALLTGVAGARGGGVGGGRYVSSLDSSRSLQAF